MCNKPWVWQSTINWLWLTLQVLPDHCTNRPKRCYLWIDSGMAKCICTATSWAMHHSSSNLSKLHVAFILDTNGSNTGIGGILPQLNEQGQEKIIAFASHTLSKSEHWYFVTRCELLRVVVFAHQFWPYLVGKEFILRTNHRCLSCL